MKSQWTHEEIHRAVKGDQALARALWDYLLVQLQLAVALILRRCTRTKVGDLRRHLQDFVQDNALYFVKDPDKTLLRWDPARLSLPGFVRLIVHRRVRRALRYKRTNPDAMDSFAPEDLEMLLAEPSTELPTLEEEIEHDLRIVALHASVAQNLSDRDRRIYRAYYVEELGSEEICRREALTPDALHQCLKRIRDRLKKHLNPH